MCVGIISVAAIGATPASISAASTKFQTLTSIYQTLSNEQNRKEYDAEHLRSRASPSDPFGFDSDEDMVRLFPYPLSLSLSTIFIHSHDKSLSHSLCFTSLNRLYKLFLNRISTLQILSISQTCLNSGDRVEGSVVRMLKCT